MAMRVKMHAVAPQPPQHMRAEAYQAWKVEQISLALSQRNISGFEMKPIRKTLRIERSTETIDVEIEKVLNWRDRNWVTADTHVHFLSPPTALLEGAAEGVNVVNLLASQWGELMTNVGDFDGATTWGSREAGGDGEHLVRVGTENRQHVLGHISLIGYSGSIIAPMTTGGPDESALGDSVEVLLSEWAEAMRCSRAAPSSARPARTSSSRHPKARRPGTWATKRAGSSPRR